MKPALLAAALLLHALVALRAVDGLSSKTIDTKNPVALDPAKALPRYPAVEATDAIATWKVKPGFHLEFAAHEPQGRDPIAVMREVRPHPVRISGSQTRTATATARRPG